MTRLFFIVAAALLTAMPALADTPLIICPGQFAFCGASATVPTGKTITIKGVVFQEGVSVCPVLPGPALGNRNMIGSCKPPNGKKTVWSLFAAMQEYPQAPTWAVLPAAPRTFVTTAGAGGMSNQWSYPCTIRPVPVNGVTLADCLGPLNESPWNGVVVPVGTTVITAAPVGAPYPVGGNLP